MSRAHPWMPSSPCGPSCVTGARDAGTGRRVLRLAALAGAMLAGVGVALSLWLLPGRGRRTLTRGWFRLLLRATGARLEVHGPRQFGEVPGRGVLVAGNHVSWLDIVALNAVQPMRMVAKREIRSWPLVGLLATRAGTVYLDRERLSTLPRAVAALAAALRAGSVVGVFPEGTTWCGRASGRLRPAAFQAALDAGVPVRPVALRYRLADGTATTGPAFVGDLTLGASVWHTVGLRRLVVEVHVLDELAPGSAANRKQWAARTQLLVRRRLDARAPGLPSAAVHPEIPLRAASTL